MYARHRYKLYFHEKSSHMAAVELANLKVVRGKRSYFFDIKKSRKGDLYLLISESVKTTSGFEHHRLMVFTEDLASFMATAEKSFAKFNEIKSAAAKTKKV